MQQEAGCSPILNRTFKGQGMLHPEDYHTEDTSEQEEKEDDEEEEENDKKEEKEEGDGRKFQ